MQPSRRQVLASLFVLSLVVAGLVLHRVLWTAVFGVTVAYVLLPVHHRLVSRGLSRWWAAVGTTVFGTVVVLVPVGIAAMLLYRRRGPVLEFIVSLPESVEIAAFGFSYAIETEALLRAGVLAATGVAVEVASALPSLGLKLTLFGFVVFGLLLGHESVESAVMGAVPSAYRDVVGALAARVRDTLYSIYVLQAVTGAATFVIAIPVFWALGYPIPYTLAFLSGVLQFLPIVGPSILILAVAAYEIAVADGVGAVLILVLGGVLIAWLPDVLVRPRLSRRTARMPGTLYYVGFVGGLLTVGPVGIVVGPIAVALVAETLSLLDAELD